MSQRQEILDLFSGKKPAHIPAFSGLIHVTAAGLERAGLSLREAHHDAAKMARAAASTFRLTGMPSASLPLDLCAPAEALGAELHFYEDRELQFPQVKRALVETSEVLSESLQARSLSKDFRSLGRLPIICEAIGLVKNDFGDEVVISGMIPGPYTLLLYLRNPKSLFIEMKKEPGTVIKALLHLSSFLAEIGTAYKNAGADYITVHEMGGSPGFIGPARFEQFVLPALKELLAHLPMPRVLSVCGNADKSMQLLGQAGAQAVSLDQTVDLAAARAALRDVLLFGNLDPVRTLWQGSQAEVAEAASKAREAGVDAVWPGCDLVIPTPARNIKGMSSSLH
jgi:[methyl-Co(III) methanol-specific corrinoid protein]:coenzyme M methyltransferase